MLHDIIQGIGLVLYAVGLWVSISVSRMQRQRHEAYMLTFEVPWWRTRYVNQAYHAVSWRKHLLYTFFCIDPSMLYRDYYLAVAFELALEMNRLDEVLRHERQPVRSGR